MLEIVSVLAAAKTRPVSEHGLQVSQHLMISTMLFLLFQTS